MPARRRLRCQPDSSFPASGEPGAVQSFGVMVNYLYDPDAIEANHEAFVHSGTVARSAQVDGLLSLPAPQPEPPPAKRRLPRIRAS